MSEAPTSVHKFQPIHLHIETKMDIQRIKQQIEQQIEEQKERAAALRKRQDELKEIKQLLNEAEELKAQNDALEKSLFEEEALLGREPAPVLEPASAVTAEQSEPKAKPELKSKPPKRKKGKKGKKAKPHSPIRDLTLAITGGALATIVGRGLTNVPGLELQGQHLRAVEDKLELTRQELKLAETFARRELDPALGVIKELHSRQPCYMLSNPYRELPPSEQLQSLLADPGTGPVMKDELWRARYSYPPNLDLFNASCAR